MQKLGRVFRMPGEEVRTRLRQEYFKCADGIRHYAGLRPAEEKLGTHPVDSAAFFFGPADLPEVIKILRERLPAEAAGIVERADRIRAHRFDLLGYEGLDFGDPIDWHLDPVHGIRAPRRLAFRIPFLEFERVGDHKIIWELNRHQHLVTLAKAWLFTHEDHYVAELTSQWKHWRAQNPYPIGINWASSLEVAFRSLSWIWVDRLLAACRAVSEEFRKALEVEVGRSGRYIERFLSTYFAPNTHLIGEAVALLFIGTLYPKFVSAERWRRTGWEIVLNEARRQVRNDGLHFEQSIYYHVYALDFFLHARMLAARNGVDPPAEFDATIERMAEALCALSQAGPAPRFGDDDGGRVFDPGRNRPEHLADPLSTAAALYGRSDFKAAAGGLREETVWLLGGEAVSRFDGLAGGLTEPGSLAFEQSGIYVMSSAEPVRRQIALDSGPLGAFSGGHGHADALSFSFTACGREWLIDPGTFCYPVELAERNLFRGTAAHNTVRIDGRDQAEPGGPFSWRSVPVARAERWVRSDTLDLFTGSHDGYRRLPRPVVHRRWIVSWKQGGFIVRDVLVGSGTHNIEQFWHLGPAFRIEDLRKSVVVFGEPAGGALLLTAADGSHWSREIEEGYWSAAYGSKTAGMVVRYEGRADLPAELCVSVVPLFTASAPRVSQLRQTGAVDGVSGYRSEDAYATRMIWFSEAGVRWEWQGWNSDAAFISYSALPGALGRQLHFVEGSFLELDGKPVLTCSKQIAWCECRVSLKEAEVRSSDDSLIRQFDSAPLRRRSP